MVDREVNLPTVKEKIWYLKKINIFSGLSMEEMMFLDRNSRMQSFSKGNTIYIGDRDHDKIFFLKKGKVKLLKIDLTGKEMVHAILKENEIFGSLSQLRENINSEYAEALSETLVCYIKKDRFFKFIESKPSIMVKLNKLLSSKVVELELLIEELTFKSVYGRIISLLMKLNQKFGINYKENILINISLTHNDIASMIGATRESTTLALNKLKDQNLIYSEKKKIIIENIDKLSELYNG